MVREEETQEGSLWHGALRVERGVWAEAGRALARVSEAQGSLLHANSVLQRPRTL